MSGGERGRRNTGYWATFNNWWRAHLEKHGERPKAEDLKRWFREESRLAFPNDPPTYTMIRNHAKGLRDIASVKHYFRDYRARKRRAVADLAGEPSPRSDPDEEDNSGGTGSPSDDACTSDEDWQGDSKKRRQNRERRKKRAQQDAKQQGAACTGEQQQLHQASGAAAARQIAEASASALEEQGDLTVTVTVTHSKRQPASRCVPRLESPLSSALPTGLRAPPIQRQVTPQRVPQQLQLQQPQQHLNASGDLALKAHQSGAVAAAPDSTCHATTLWGPGFGWRSAHEQETLQSGGFPGCTAGEPDGAGPGLQVGLHNQAQQQRLQCKPQLQRQHQLSQQQQHTHLTHEGSTPGGSMEQQPPPSGKSSRRDASVMHPSLFKSAEESKPAEEMAAAQQQQQQLPMDPHPFPPPHSHGPGRSMAGAGRGSYGVGEAWGAAAATGAAAPLAPGAPATHLSPMSSQPVPPADAASTSSTDMHRGGGRLPAADLSASGSVNPEAACAGGGAGTSGGAAAGKAGALGLVKNEELYIGLHGSAAGMLRDLADGGGGRYSGLSLHVSSASGDGNQAQPWTPFAILISSGSEPRHPAATAAAAPAGGAAAMESVSPRAAGGGTYDMQSSISPSRRRSPLAGPSLHPRASDCAAAPAAGGEPGLLSGTPGSAPILDDAAVADLQRVAWLQRQRGQYHSMGLGGRPGGSGGGGRGADASEHATSSGRGHMHGSPTGPSPLSVASPHVGVGNNLGAGLQMSLPAGLLGGAGLPAPPGAGCYQSAGDAKFQQQQPPQQLQQQQMVSLATHGPPPVTTGFTPSKGAPRASAVSSSSGGASLGAVVLQAGSPGAGQVPAPLAGQIILTGAGSSPAAGGAAALPATVDASSPGGAVTAAGTVTAAATAAIAAGATHPAVAAEAIQEPMGAVSRSGLLPAAASCINAGFAGSGVLSGERSPGASPCAWSLAPLRTKALPPTVPFPAPFPPASPAAAAAASPLSPTHSGGLPPGIASNSPSGRARRVPYPPMLHQRAGALSPWYQYPYPAAQTGHPVPSPRAAGFPGPYGPYGRPLVRRRYMSAPSCTQPLPPLPHPLPPQPQPLQYLHQQQPLQQQHMQEHEQQLHQQYVMQQYQQQQQQQQYPGARNQPVPPSMPVGMGASWPDGRPSSVCAQSFSTTNAEPWVAGPGYEDARSHVLASAASAPVPPMGDAMDHRHYMTDAVSLGDMQMAGWAADGGGGYNLRTPPMEMAVATAGVALPMASTVPGAPPASNTGGDECIFTSIFGICSGEDEAIPVVFGSGAELGSAGGGGGGMVGAAPMQPGAASGGGSGPDMPGMMMGYCAQQDAHGAGASHRDY